MEALKDRLQTLTQNIATLRPAYAVALVVLVLSIFLGTLLLRAYNRPQPITIKDVASPGESTSTTLPAKIVVHVAGAVKNSGVFELGDGARLGTAIKEAGGPQQNADLHALNLAAKLRDGQRVYVPAIGEEVDASLGSSLKDAADTDVGSAAPIDINSASQREIEELPGIGPVIAERIIKHRAEKGFFQAIEELQSVEGIGPRKYEQIKDLISTS